MGRIESVDAIRDTLIAMIARHARVPAASIDDDTHIWTKFPPSHREDPSVTAFVEDVHAEFKVHLTEHEWENPTLTSVTERIRAKRENPALSVDDWNRERAALRGGRTWMIGMALVLAGVAFFGARGSSTWRVFVAMFIFVLIAAVGVVGVHISTRRLGPRPPR